MVIVTEAVRAEGVAGEVVARESSVKGARGIDCSTALSERRLYVVNVVLTRPRNNRASQQAVRVSGAMMIVVKVLLQESKLAWNHECLAAREARVMHNHT